MTDHRDNTPYGYGSGYDSGSGSGSGEQPAQGRGHEELPHPPGPYAPEGSGLYAPDGTGPYAPDGTGPYPPEGAGSYAPEGAAPYASDGTAPYASDGTGPYAADATGSYAPDGTYVPEPLPAAVPPHAGQDLPFGAPPPGDGWSAHTAGQDGSPYGAPASPHPWTPPQEPWAQYAEPSGYGDPAGQGSPGYASPGYGTPAPGAAGAAAGFDGVAPGHMSPGYGGAAGEPWQQQVQPQPHAYDYAEPQAHGVEHTAVLPVIPEADENPAPAGGRAARREAGPVRADGRTGSPIIAPGVQPAALTAGLGLLLAGGAAVGKPALAVVLVLLQAVTAAGWFRLNGMWPARQGIVLAFLAGVTADVAMLAANGSHAPVVMAGTLGIWLLLVLVLQLRHHGSADERLSSLTATSASTLITVLACGYLAALVSDAGHGPVVTGAVAVAAATLVRALPLPGEPLSLAAALLVAAGAGALTAHTGGLAGGDGVLLAVACGACALIGLRVASYDFPSRFVHFTAGVALPLTAAAPVVYALGRALT